MPAPANLIHETGATVGAGNFTLAAENGKQRFGTAFGTGVSTNVFDYFISNRDAAEWERGTGHMSDANTLVRDTVLQSSNANALVAFTAGRKDVTNDVPAGTQFYGSAGGTDNRLIRADGTGQALQGSTATLDDSGALSVVSLLDLSSATAGQIKFPATQNPSADTNTLDDYEEGTWTPTITFATPGDLSVTYSSQLGTYTKIGRSVTVQAQVVTATFTHATASGALKVSGLPFTVEATQLYRGPAVWGGLTLAAGYTQVDASAFLSQTYMEFRASGSAVSSAAVNATEVPTGGTVALRPNVTYFA